MRQNEKRNDPDPFGSAAYGIRLDFTQVDALLASRHATDAKAATRKSRRWRDGVKDGKEAANDGRWMRRAA